MRARRSYARASDRVEFGPRLVFAVSAAGASVSSAYFEQELAQAARQFVVAASNYGDRRREREEMYRRLSRRWREDTQFLSSVTETAMHPAYQGIIGMGDDALPLILDDLSRDSGHWFWALKAISKEDPVAPAERGDVKRMRAAWLRWGREKGLHS